MLKWMTRAVLDCYVQFVQKFNKLRSCLVKKLKLRLFFFLSSFFFFKVTQYWTKASQALKTYKVVLQLTYVGHLMPLSASLCFFFSVFFRVCVFFSFPVVQSVTRWFFLHLYQRQCVVDRCYQLSSKFLSQRGLYSLCYCKFTAGLQSAVLVRYSLRSHTFKTYSFSR